MKAQKIRALSERAKAREKISVWFGSEDNFYHPIREVIQNAVDEIMKSYGRGKISVHLHEDNKTVTITDTGRGMPVIELDEETNDPYWKLLFLQLFAGGNYDNNETGDEAGGTNGVGNTVTCYTSDYFRCDAYYKGTHYVLEFEDGGNIVGGEENAIQVKGPTEEHGTSITFRLSDEVYTDTTFDEFEVEEIVRRFASCANTIDFSFKYKEKEAAYHYDTIEDYFDSITTSLTSKRFSGYEKEYENEIRNQAGEITKGTEKNRISVVFATSSEVVQESYLNYNFLREGGYINDGIVRGIRNYLNKHLKSQKENVSINDKDVLDSLSFVCKFSSTRVSFSNQTKFSTKKKVYKDVAIKYAEEIMEVMFNENRQEFEKLLKHVLEVRKFNEKSSKGIKKLKQQLTEKVDNIVNRVANLDDCKIHDETAELFICEGLSAKGSIVLSRDAVFQAVIAMKGKVLNCLKADYATIFQNKAILDLVKTLGCGIEADKKNKELGTFDIKKLRYGKVLLAADADPDGLQIVCLLLTMFYRLMPQLLEEGRIYIVKTPLYENKLKDDSVLYTFSEDEQKELVSTNKDIVNIARAKGLGELDAEYMAKVGVNPETRFVEQVTIQSAEKMHRAFENWMGHDPKYRKQYLEAHLKEYLEEI